MRQFTKEEIERLSVQELNFKRAVESQYKCATISKVDDMIYEIYVSATDDKSLTRNWSCSYCSYKLYEKCGRKYFADKEAYEQLELEKKKTDNQTDNNKKRKKATK